MLSLEQLLWSNSAIDCDATTLSFRSSQLLVFEFVVKASPGDLEPKLDMQHYLHHPRMRLIDHKSAKAAGKL